jgi:hypothetical protein
MPRPKRTDDAVIAAAARNVVSQLIESSPNDYNEKERDEYEADLRRALRYAPSDGYEIAKELDRLGWAVDAMLVEDLSGDPIDSALRDAVGHWVKTGGITPRFALGDKVRVTFTWFDKGTHDGEIARIDEFQATYTVCIPALGHVPPGKMGTQGRVLTFEEVEAENPAQEVDEPRSLSAIDPIGATER